MRHVRWLLGTILAMVIACPAGAQSPQGQARLAEIEAELAWMAEPLTFPFRLTARFWPQGLEIVGQVPNEETQRRAVELGRRHSGLSAVAPPLVNPNLSHSWPSVSTSILQGDAAAVLRQVYPDPSRDLKIAARYDGALTVTGTVYSYEEKLAVSKRLSAVHGCTSVSNQLTVAAVKRAGQTGLAVSADGRLLLASAAPAGEELKVIAESGVPPSMPTRLPERNPRLEPVPAAESALPLQPVPERELTVIATTPESSPPPLPAAPPSAPTTPVRPGDIQLSEPLPLFLPDRVQVPSEGPSLGLPATEEEPPIRTVAATVPSRGTEPDSRVSPPAQPPAPAVTDTSAPKLFPVEVASHESASQDISTEGPPLSAPGAVAPELVQPTPSKPSLPPPSFPVVPAQPLNPDEPQWKPVPPEELIPKPAPPVPPRPAPTPSRGTFRTKPAPVVPPEVPPEAGPELPPATTDATPPSAPSPDSTEPPRPSGPAVSPLAPLPRPGVRRTPTPPPAVVEEPPAATPVEPPTIAAQPEPGSEPTAPIASPPTEAAPMAPSTTSPTSEPATVEPRPTRAEPSRESTGALPAPAAAVPVPRYAPEHRLGPGARWHGYGAARPREQSRY